jgi:hypothetical protein
MRNTAVIRKEGMDCLLKTLGVLETEVFISSLLRERFDYTEWQREYFAGCMADGQTYVEAVQNAEIAIAENLWC